MLMKFKEGDRVHVKRLNEVKTDFYATLSGFDSYNETVYLVNCTDKSHEGKEVYLPIYNYFGPDKVDYYTLSKDEEDTEEPVIQHTDTLDNGEIIAQSIVDNRDGASFISAHEMIVFLNEVEEMHGETISVKGWNLIFDYIKASIAPAYFGRD